MNKTKLNVAIFWFLQPCFQWYYRVLLPYNIYKVSNTITRSDNRNPQLLLKHTYTLLPDRLVFTTGNSWVTIPLQSLKDLEVFCILKLAASVQPSLGLISKIGCWRSRHGASDCMLPVFSPVELRGRCPMAEWLSAAGLRSKLPGCWVWLAHHKQNDPRGKATEPWPPAPLERSKAPPRTTMERSLHDFDLCCPWCSQDACISLLLKSTVKPLFAYATIAFCCLFTNLSGLFLYLSPLTCYCPVFLSDIFFSEVNTTFLKIW